jgi:hypothetical protein
MLVACNEGPAYLDQSEENLGLREAWYGTDHRVFHAALLYPTGSGCAPAAISSPLRR